MKKRYTRAGRYRVVVGARPPSGVLCDVLEMGDSGWRMVHSVVLTSDGRTFLFSQGLSAPIAGQDMADFLSALMVGHELSRRVLQDALSDAECPRCLGTGTITKMAAEGQ